MFSHVFGLSESLEKRVRTLSSVGSWLLSGRLPWESSISRTDGSDLPRIDDIAIAQRESARDSSELEDSSEPRDVQASSAQPLSFGDLGRARIRITWRDDVRTALEHLGGRASLSQIYKKARRIRKD